MKNLRPALTLTLFFALFTGLLFPLVVTGLAQAALPSQANGSLLVVEGKPLGSALIGQNFSGDRWFHPRPSSGGYDANNSGGTNLGPTNPKLLTGADGFDGVKQLAEGYRVLNGVAADVVLPVDAVTRSASGLDPHISVANARLQAARVARANGLSQEEVNRLISEIVDPRLGGIFGEDGVNVLKLNLKVSRAVPKPL